MLDIVQCFLDRLTQELLLGLRGLQSHLGVTISNVETSGNAARTIIQSMQKI